MNAINNLFDYSSLIGELQKSNFILNQDNLPAIFSDPRIQKYFDRVPDSKMARKQDASVEKMLGTAIAKLISRQTGVPTETIVAGTRKALDLIRNTKMKNLVDKGLINEETYRKLTSYSKSSWFISGVKSVYKFFKKKGLTKAINKAVKFIVKKIPHPVVQAAVRIWDAIPQPVKEVAKTVAMRCVEKVVEKAPVVAQKLYDAGKKVVKKSAEIIYRGAEKAIETGRKIVDKVKPIVKAAAQKAVSWGSKVVSTTSSFVKKIFSWA